MDKPPGVRAGRFDIPKNYVGSPWSAHSTAASFRNQSGHRGVEMESRFRSERHDLSQ